MTCAVTACGKRDREGFLSMVPADATVVAWTDAPLAFLESAGPFVASALQPSSPSPNGNGDSLDAAEDPLIAFIRFLLSRDVDAPAFTALLDGSRPCGLFAAPRAEGGTALGLVLPARDQIAIGAWLAASARGRGLTVLDRRKTYILIAEIGSGLALSSGRGSVSEPALHKGSSGLHVRIDPASPFTPAAFRMLDAMAPRSPDDIPQVASKPGMVEATLEFDGFLARLSVDAVRSADETDAPIDASGPAARWALSWPEGWKGFQRFGGPGAAFGSVSTADLASLILCAARGIAPPAMEPGPGPNIAFWLESRGNRMRARFMVAASGLKEALSLLGGDGIEDAASYLTSGKPRLAVAQAIASHRGPSALPRPALSSATNPALSRYYCSLSRWDQATLDELMRALQAVPLPGSLRVDAPELRGAMAGMDRDPFSP